MVWRSLIGIDRLKIGELAEITGITKRTIDYYTNLGLLKAERSSSNYRYYSVDMIDRIKEIEKKKSQNMSLEEIKKKMDIDYCDEVDIQDLRLRIQLLEQDLSHLVNHLDHSDTKEKILIKQKISTESVALMQSLLLLIT
ncbi:MerR family transcriptional regulator [Lysinibacillus sp. M3]|uniref:MerR family transcriptional regulator n=1 Tax=Lysinibacillus zambalensis TaxID=3160866 RepID=A0ABV1ML17_9BACI